MARNRRIKRSVTRVTVYLTHRELAELKTIAEVTGLSLSDVVRLMLVSPQTLLTLKRDTEVKEDAGTRDAQIIE